MDRDSNYRNSDLGYTFDIDSSDTLFVITHDAVDESDNATSDTNIISDDADIKRILKKYGVKNNPMSFKCAGIITFSPKDVQEDDIDSKFISFVDSLYNGIVDKITRNNRLTNIRMRNLYCWTIGKYLNNIYGYRKNDYNNDSFSIMIKGDNFEFGHIVDIAKEICNEFNYNSVILDDIRKKRTYKLERRK